MQNEKRRCADPEEYFNKNTGDLMCRYNPDAISLEEALEIGLLGHIHDTDSNEKEIA